MAKKNLTIIKPKKKKLIVTPVSTKPEKDKTDIIIPYIPKEKEKQELTEFDIEDEEEEYIEDSDIEEIDIEESSNYIFDVADTIEEDKDNEVNIIVPKSKIDKSSLIDVFKTTELTKEKYNY